MAQLPEMPSKGELYAEEASARRRGWMAEKIAIPSLAAVEIAGVLGLAGFYLATVLPRLADYPVVGGDEGWIISTSAKLARKGVFGSDLFTGFHDAQSHYYFNLPLQHLILAGVYCLWRVRGSRRHLLLALLVVGLAHASLVGTAKMPTTAQSTSTG